MKAKTKIDISVLEKIAEKCTVTYCRFCIFQGVYHDERQCAFNNIRTEYWNLRKIRSALDKMEEGEK